MKHIVTDLEAINEPVMFKKFVLGNYFLDSFFGSEKFEMSPFAESNTHSELFHCTFTHAEKDESNFAAQINLKMDSSNSNLGI